MSWSVKLRRLVPTRDTLLANRWLRWLSPWLAHPSLWHWSRRGVSLGVGLGVFFGLLIPLAQIPVSAVAAVVLRANLPVAAASTLVTNPVTFGPIYLAAYHLGAWLTGEEIKPGEAKAALDASHDEEAQSWWKGIVGVGKPLLAGLATLAVSFGLSTYAVITLLWRWRVQMRWRARCRQRRI